MDFGYWRAGQNMPENQLQTILPVQGKGLKIIRNARVLVDIEDIELGRQGVTSVIGHNGAGKTLLLKLLTGLIRPDQGVVTWNGKAPWREGYAKLGYMKQNAVMLRRSAKANLEFVVRQAGLDHITGISRAKIALEKAGLSHIANTSARLLSGGEKQRLSLARVLIGEPEIVILDEPTAGLDPVSLRAIENTIADLRKKAIPVVLVTHDIAQARRLSDFVMFVDQGKILAHLPADEFFSIPPCIEADRFLNGIM